MNRLFDFFNEMIAIFRNKNKTTFFMCTFSLAIICILLCIIAGNLSPTINDLFAKFLTFFSQVSTYNIIMNSDLSTKKTVFKL